MPHAVLPYLTIQYLSFTVDARLGGDEHRRRRPLQEHVRLTLDIHLIHAVTQLLKVELRLDVLVLASLDRLWGPLMMGVESNGLLLLLLEGSALGLCSTTCLLLALELHRVWTAGTLQSANHSKHVMPKKILSYSRSGLSVYLHFGHDRESCKNG